MRAGRGCPMELKTIRGVRRSTSFGHGVATIAITVALLLGVEAIGAHAAFAEGATNGATNSVSVIPGWPGGPGAYTGRYRLTASGDAGFARSGTLTIFARTVPHQAKPQMSGILSLYTTDGTNVLYLAHFVHAGTTRSAQVSLGIYTGPEIGRFVMVSRHGAALAARFVPLKGAPVSLRFVEFSTSPHP